MKKQGTGTKKRNTLLDREGKSTEIKRASQSMQNHVKAFAFYSEEESSKNLCSTKRNGMDKKWSTYEKKKKRWILMLMWVQVWFHHTWIQERKVPERWWDGISAASIFFSFFIPFSSLDSLLVVQHHHLIPHISSSRTLLIFFSPSTPSPFLSLPRSDSQPKPIISFLRELYCEVWMCIFFSSFCSSKEKCFEAQNKFSRRDLFLSFLSF